MPVAHIVVYSFTLGLGLYLLARNDGKSGLRHAGWGLIGYAFSIVLALFLQGNPVWLRLPVMLPAVLWLGAVLHLLPDVPVNRAERLLLRLAWPYAFAAFAVGFFDDALGRWLSIVVPFFVLAGIRLRLTQINRMGLPRPPLLIMATATLFFLLSGTLILLPQDWLRQDWVVLSMSVDLVLLGYAVALLDAYDEGNSLRRDSLRALAAGSVALAAVVGQVMIAAAFTGTSEALNALAFGLVTVVLSGVMFYDRLQALLDRLVLREDDVRYRENLRSVSSAVMRRAEDNDLLAQMDGAEFSRITRRALAHYGDLNKLAASPLMQLPVLSEHASLLDRANALKSLLREHVERLKPDSPDEFATQDEWRYYNVLYFPYVRGLKPYSTRLTSDLSDVERRAINWFQAYVPERTLYNWQKNAAELVAHSLRD